MIANVKKSVFNLEMLDAVKRETTSAPAILDNQVGVVLAIPLNQIIEDEHQPRKDFNDENWQDFVSDVKRRHTNTDTRASSSGWYLYHHPRCQTLPRFTRGRIKYDNSHY